MVRDIHSFLSFPRSLALRLHFITRFASLHKGENVVGNRPRIKDSSHPGKPNLSAVTGHEQRHGLAAGGSGTINQVFRTAVRFFQRIGAAGAAPPYLPGSKAIFSRASGSSYDNGISRKEKYQCSRFNKKMVQCKSLWGNVLPAHEKVFYKKKGSRSKNFFQFLLWLSRKGVRGKPSLGP